MKKRLEYVDAAKGIGMLLIVLGHISSSWGIISNWGSYFKISIFYVISGYMQFKSKKELCIAKKAKSILIPYVFFSVISLIIILGKSLIRKDDFNYLVIQIIKTISFRGIGTLWFFPSLFIAVLLHKAFLKSRIVKPLLLVIIPMTLIIASGIVSFKMHVDISFRYFLFCVVITLVKGIVAYWFYEMSYLLLDKISNKDKRNINVLTALITFFICSLCTVMIKESDIDFNNVSFGIHPSLFFAFGIIIPFDIIICFEKLRFHCKPLQYIGENSLFIMCTHLTLYIVPIVSKLVKIIIDRIWLPEKAEYLVFVLISLFCVFMIEMLMIKAWNKIKPYLIKHKAICFCRYI